MSNEERLPITEDYLALQGAPMVTSPCQGIVAVISGDGYETVDMLPEHAEQVAERLLAWAKRLRGEIDD